MSKSPSSVNMTKESGTWGERGKNLQRGRDKEKLIKLETDTRNNTPLNRVSKRADGGRGSVEGEAAVRHTANAWRLAGAV